MNTKESINVSPKSLEAGSQRLLDLVTSHTWSVGNPNFDSDPHIGWHYLIASSQLAPPLGDSKLAYKTILSFSDNFNETYFVPQSEVDKVAETVCDLTWKSPGWMSAVLGFVKLRSDSLSQYWDILRNDDFSEYQLEDLKEIYDANTQMHISLYDVARIPESLDRGNEIFTNRLKSNLKMSAEKKYGSSPDSVTLNRWFRTLTAPEEFSEIEMEEISEVEIARDILNDPEGSAYIKEIKTGKKERWMYLPAKYRERLDNHLSRFRYKTYHGYADREPDTIAHIFDKVVAWLDKEPDKYIEDQMKKLQNRVDHKEQLFDELDIPLVDRHVFRLYPQIGLAKMYRRCAQLKNFYYLDKLIEEIARRFSLTEAAVRSSTPLEVSVLLDASRPGIQLHTLQELQTRENRKSVYVIHNKESFSVRDSDIFDKAFLLLQYERDEFDSNELKGQSIWPGKVSGKIVLAIRPEDLNSARLPKDEPIIIMSGSTDPDLMVKIGELRRGGINILGIITETGGVTSHAAITATEMEIPTVIGVPRLLTRLSTGQLVTVDADMGSVFLSEDAVTKDNPLQPLPSLLSSDNLPRDVGNKAYNIGLLENILDKGFTVPKGFVLPTAIVSHELGIASGVEASEYKLTDNVGRLVTANLSGLALSEKRMLTIRSSTASEDSIDSAKAGYFTTYLRIKPDELIEKLGDYIYNVSRQTQKDSYIGGIIVQEMIDELDISGVVFTQDPNPSHPYGENTMIIEVTEGHNESITDGSATPTQVIIERDAFFSGGIKQIAQPSSSRQSPSKIHDQSTNLIRLAQEAMKIEKKLSENFGGVPVDIEWGISRGKLYIFQVRPLTTFYKR